MSVIVNYINKANYKRFMNLSNYQKGEKFMEKEPNKKRAYQSLRFKLIAGGILILLIPLIRNENLITT